jgi:hypothetical protein
MTYKEIEKILIDSKREDWINFIPLGKNEITYKEDLNLVIKKDLEIKEEPITTFNYIFLSDIGQYPCWYDVYYKSSLVARVKMLEVSSRDITLPFGMNDFTKVKELDVNLASIIDLGDLIYDFVDVIGYEIVRNPTILDVM